MQNRNHLTIPGDCVSLADTIYPKRHSFITIFLAWRWTYWSIAVSVWNWIIVLQNFESMFNTWLTKMCLNYVKKVVFQIYEQDILFLSEWHTLGGFLLFSISFQFREIKLINFLRLSRYTNASIAKVNHANHDCHKNDHHPHALYWHKTKSFVTSGIIKCWHGKGGSARRTKAMFICAIYIPVYFCSHESIYSTE